MYTKDVLVNKRTKYPRNLAVEIRRNGNDNNTDLYKLKVYKIICVKLCMNIKINQKFARKPIRGFSAANSNVNKLILENHRFFRK